MPSMRMAPGQFRAYVTGAASASSVASAIDNLEDDVQSLEQSIWKWGVNTYGPAGIKGASATSTNTVATEQRFYDAWADWCKTWGSFREKIRDALKLGGIGWGSSAIEDYTDGWMRDIEKFRIDYAAWKTRAAEVIAAHGDTAKAKKIDKSLPGKPPDSGIWGTVLVVAGAGAVGTLAYMIHKRISKRELSR